MADLGEWQYKYGEESTGGDSAPTTALFESTA